VAVREVTAGSCSEKAGLKAGDVILSADGRKLASTEDLLAVLMEKKPGDKVKLRVLRGGKEIDVEPELDARP
jgi:S1-C subfamily serine protease